MSLSRRDFNTQLILGGASVAPAAPRRPNVIFVLTDDQRWDSMGCAGHPFLKTPNMDRLAREGARFTNAFVTTSLCSPSRASFLTGRYARAHGVIGNWQDIPDREMERSFPALLRRAGYETAYVGKFHMGVNSSARGGFDYWAALPGQGRYLNPDVIVNDSVKKFSGHSSKVVTELALEWLERPRQKPFCLIVGYKEVHGPHTPPAHVKNLYADRKFTLPPVRPEDLRGKPEEVRAVQLGNPDVPPSKIPGFPQNSIEEEYRDYWRTITAADEQIGRILKLLDDTGRAEDTLLVFAGDNGFFMGELGLFDKRFAYEPSIRVPLLLRYPRSVKAGTVIDRMALNIDLCPTVLDYAGVAAPPGVHGASWRPLLEQRPVEWRRWFLYEYFREPGYVFWPTIQALRTEQWKYIRYPEGGNQDELYDLIADPGERNNLSHRKDNPGLAELGTMTVRLGWEIDRIIEQISKRD
jgi:arylsulfatase A-like enzyme